MGQQPTLSQSEEDGRLPNLYEIVLNLKALFHIEKLWSIHLILPTDESTETTLHQEHLKD